MLTLVETTEISGESFVISFEKKEHNFVISSKVLQKSVTSIPAESLIVIRICGNKFKTMPDLAGTSGRK
ncbi:hypothetical protein CREGCYN_13010 [Synechococcus sp. M16CYN]